MKYTLLQSKWMALLLSLLPRGSKLASTDTIGARQIIHILSLLVLLVEPVGMCVQRHEAWGRSRLRPFADASVVLATMIFKGCKETWGTLHIWGY